MAASPSPTLPRSTGEGAAGANVNLPLLFLLGSVRPLSRETGEG